MIADKKCKYELL